MAALGGGDYTDQTHWTKKHPDNWTIDDISAWGNHVADENSMVSSIRRALIVNLRRFTGKQLLRMRYGDVKRMFPDVQDILYTAMQKYFSGYGEFQEKEPKSTVPRGIVRSVSESEVEKQKAEQERSRLRWTHIHPDHWSTVEVASWLNFVADEHRIPLDERTDMLDAFDSVTGSQLLFMTKEQFVAADQTRGGQIFEIFRNVYPAGLRQTLEESENKDFLLPPITEDSGSGSSRDTSPHTRRNKNEPKSTVPRSIVRSVSESEVEKQKAEQERSRLRWTHIHPDHWSTVEVASWLNFIADEHRIPLDERTDMLDAFDSVTGSQLLFMTKEQFVAADQTRGGQIFKNVYPAGLRQYLEESENKAFLLPPITEDSGSGSSRDTSPHTRRKSSSI